MNGQSIVNFLLIAKKQTYANAKMAKSASTRLGSKDYEYTETIGRKRFTYHDTYFGKTKFIGEEVVYIDADKPTWGMNYYGAALDESLTEEVVDGILRPALMQVGKDPSVLPLRGPGHFEHEGYIYTFEVDGDIFRFTGTEKIFKGDNLIYIGHCHGGTIN